MKKISLLYVLILAQTKSFAQIINFYDKEKSLTFNCQTSESELCRKVIAFKLKHQNSIESDIELEMALKNGTLNYLLEKENILNSDFSSEGTMCGKCGSNNDN